MELSREQLVEIITSEVLRITGENPAPLDKSGLPKALVIGSPDRLPRNVADRYDFTALCERGQSCEFGVIYITDLACRELADIALGRDVDAVTSAVTGGLMRGSEIFLLDCALGFRKYSGTMSRGFYQLMEGYVRTLQSYGIKLVNGQTPIDKFVARTAPEDGLPDGIVTEALAVKLAEKAEGGTVILKKGTVVTPSAKDVFLHAGKSVEFY